MLPIRSDWHMAGLLITGSIVHGKLAHCGGWHTQGWCVTPHRNTAQADCSMQKLPQANQHHTYTWLISNLNIFTGNDTGPPPACL